MLQRTFWRTLDYKYIAHRKFDILNELEWIVQDIIEKWK